MFVYNALLKKTKYFCPYLDKFNLIFFFHCRRSIILIILTLRSEKTASIHKSKYEHLLEQDRQRLNRNAELLHMLDDVDRKAVTLATKTERLRMLKVPHNTHQLHDGTAQ